MNNTELKPYLQIDWSKPPPLIKQLNKRCKLSAQEAHHLNKGLALNGFTLRWIPDES